MKEDAEEEDRTRLPSQYSDLASDLMGRYDSWESEKEETVRAY